MTLAVLVSLGAPATSAPPASGGGEGVLQEVVRALQGREFTKVLAYCRETLDADPDFEPCYRLAADAAFLAGTPEAAEAAFRELAAARPGSPFPRWALGTCHRRSGRLREALSAYEEALERKPLWVAALRDYLWTARAAGALDGAVGKLRRGPLRASPERLYAAAYGRQLAYRMPQALALLRQAEARRPMPQIHLARAQIRLEQGRRGQCREEADRGLALVRASPDPGLEADLQLAKAECTDTTGQDDGAHAAQAAVDVATRLGDPHRRADGLRRSSYAAIATGDLPEARRLLEEAAGVHDALGEPQSLAADLVTLAHAVTMSSGSRNTATEILRKALVPSARARDPRTEVRVRGTLGASLLMTGRKDEALGHLLDALRSAEAIGARHAMATNCGNLSQAFADLGDHVRAEEYGVQALRHYRASENLSGEAMTLGGLGDYCWQRNELRCSLRYHREAVAVARRTRTPSALLAEALPRLARDEARRGRQSLAWRLLDEAVVHNLRNGGLPLVAARTHLTRGDLLREAGRCADALPQYEAALGAIGETEAPEDAVRAHRGLGACLAAMGRRAEALVHHRRAIAWVEDLRATAGGPTHRLSYLADRKQVYAEAVDLLFELHQADPLAGHDQEAFLAAERAKARVLLELLNPAGLPRPLLAAEVASTLPAGGVLVEWLLGARHSYVFSVSPAGALGFHRLPARRAVEGQIRRFRARLARRPEAPEGSLLGRELRRSAAALYRELLGPVDGVLEAASTLVVVPDGWLFYLPVEALVRGGRFVGEDRDVTYAPSASVHATLQTRAAPRAPPGSQLVAFGDPLPAHARGPGGTVNVVQQALEESGFSFSSLPSTRLEVERIARLFPPGTARVYLAGDFRAGTVLQEISRATRYLHFATHALVNERAPGLSGLVLSRTTGSDDPLLTARDIAALHIPADLVTLSACQTGLGSAVEGEGIVGLAHAFHQAGVRSLVASLWNVSDLATAGFMASFYGELQRGGSKSGALRRAREGMIRHPNPALRHPYYWAGFVLMGAP